MDDKQRSAKILMIAMQFVSNILVTIAIFIALGYLLDLWLNTKPIFLVIFILLGVFTGVFNLIRKVNKVE